MKTRLRCFWIIKSELRWYFCNSAELGGPTHMSSLICGRAIIPSQRLQHYSFSASIVVVSERCYCSLKSIASSAETSSFFKFTKSSVTITSFQRFTKPQTQTQKKKKKLTCTVATLKAEDTDREESIFSLLEKMNKEEDIPVEQW